MAATVRDYNDFISKVTECCIQSINTARLSSLFQLLSKKTQGWGGLPSKLQQMYEQGQLTPEEVAIDLVNELVLELAA
jgi:hypothetical protein